MGLAGLGLCCCGDCTCVECEDLGCLAFELSGGTLADTIWLTLLKCGSFFGTEEVTCEDVDAPVRDACLWVNRVHCIRLYAWFFSRATDTGTECVLRLVAEWSAGTYYDYGAGEGPKWVWDFVKPDGSAFTCEDLLSGVDGTLNTEETDAYLGSLVNASIRVYSLVADDYYGYDYYSGFCGLYGDPTHAIVNIPALSDDPCTHCEGLEGSYCVGPGGSGSNTLTGYAIQDSAEEQCCLGVVELTWYCTGEATEESPAAMYCRIRLHGGEPANAAIVWEHDDPPDIWWVISCHGSVSLPVSQVLSGACCTTTANASFGLLQRSECEVADIDDWHAWCEDLPAEVTVTVSGASSPYGYMNGSWVLSYQGVVGDEAHWRFADSDQIPSIDLYIDLLTPATSSEPPGCEEPRARIDFDASGANECAATRNDALYQGPCSGQGCLDILYGLYYISTGGCYATGITIEVGA